MTNGPVDKFTYMRYSWRCSNCDNIIPIHENVCPNCNPNDDEIEQFGIMGIAGQVVERE